MTNSLYFSERDGATPPLDMEKLSGGFWDGFVSLIRTLLKDGSLAEAFPCPCSDPGHLPIQSANRDSVQKRIHAEIPGFPWVPTGVNKPEDDLIILDGVEFFGRYVSKAVEKSYHSYGQHHHVLSFNKGEGASEYIAKINLFFRRARHPFEMNRNGEILRLGPPLLNEILRNVIATEDPVLNGLINTAVEKFRDPDLRKRKESLEKLWDAWERLKSLKDPSDKRKSVQLLLNGAIKSESFLNRIDKEAADLTHIGNQFMIRHHETNKIPIERSIEVDYLFHRLFALIYLLTKGNLPG